MDELLLKFSSMPNLDEVFVDEEQLFQRQYQGTRSKRSSISSKSVAFSNFDDRGSVVSENVRFDGRSRGGGHGHGHESAKIAYQEKRIHELEKTIKEKNLKIKQLNKRYIDILNMANEREKLVVFTSFDPRSIYFVIAMSVRFFTAYEVDRLRTSLNGLEYSYGLSRSRSQFFLSLNILNWQFSFHLKASACRSKTKCPTSRKATCPPCNRVSTSNPLTIPLCLPPLPPFTSSDVKK